VLTKNLLALIEFENGYTFVCVVEFCQFYYMISLIVLSKERRQSWCCEGYHLHNWTISL